MKIFVIYDAETIWKQAFSSFDEAVAAVKVFVTNYNANWRKTYEDDPDWEVARMEKEFKILDDKDGVLVAFNEVMKFGTYIKELTM